MSHLRLEPASAALSYQAYDLGPARCSCQDASTDYQCDLLLEEGISSECAVFVGVELADWWVDWPFTSRKTRPLLARSLLSRRTATFSWATACTRLVVSVFGAGWTHTYVSRRQAGWPLAGCSWLRYAEAVTRDVCIGVLSGVLGCVSGAWLVCRYIILNITLVTWGNKLPPLPWLGFYHPAVSGQSVSLVG